MVRALHRMDVDLLPPCPRATHHSVGPGGAWSKPSLLDLVYAWAPRSELCCDPSLELVPPRLATAYLSLSEVLVLRSQSRRLSQESNEDVFSDQILWQWVTFFSNCDSSVCQVVITRQKVKVPTNGTIWWYRNLVQWWICNEYEKFQLSSVKRESLNIDVVLDLKEKEYREFVIANSEK